MSEAAPVTPVEQLTTIPASVSIGAIGVSGARAAEISRDSAVILGQVMDSPSLDAFGRQFLEPAERRDKGAIEYTSTPEALLHWAADPFGRAKLDFIARAYGIAGDELPQVLEAAGMAQYLEAKAQGRLVGMVSAQILKPTYYFLANAFALGELGRHGVPTALMVGEYPQDRFHTENSDKRYAFGKVDFPVGIATRVVKGQEVQEIETTQIELRPYGIRLDDGSIRRISSIQEANGFRCEQILVQVVDARTGHDSYVRHTMHPIPASEDKMRITEVFSEAALGFSVPGLVGVRRILDKHEDLRWTDEAISITDFYKTLWIETINRLRETGDLPSEEEMPMFFIDAERMYSTIAQQARPSPDILEMMAFSTPERVLKEVLMLPEGEANAVLAGGLDGYVAYLASRGMRQLDNGLLVNARGMMDPGAFYIAQTAWPDLYLECSSCGGDYFVDRLRRAQMIRQRFELPESEVRLPDAEIPELEAYVVHPTGKIVRKGGPDARIPGLSTRMRDISQRIGEIQRQLKRGGAAEQQALEDAMLIRQQISDEIAAIAAEADDTHYRELEAGSLARAENSLPFVPPIIAATYRVLFIEGVEDTARQEVVQSAIRQVRSR